MNDLDLRLEVVSGSRQPLRYIRRWISRKPLEIEVWFQRTTNGKWHMAYRMVTWPMTSRDHRKCCEAVRSAILATAWLLVFSCRRHAVTVISVCTAECRWLITWQAQTAEIHDSWQRFCLRRRSSFRSASPRRSQSAGRAFVKFWTV